MFNKRKLSGLRFPNIILLLLIVMVNTADTAGQDPIYSQFYHSPLEINPAFAGNTYAPKFAANYRIQWPQIDKAYETFSFSYDQFFREMNLGIGFVAHADDAGNGLYKTVKAAGVVSYRVQINPSFYMKGGIEAGWVQNRINWDELVFYDQINPQYGTTSPGGTPYPTEEVRPTDLNQSYLDLGFGILAYSDRFYGGISVKHINQPNQNFIDTDNDLTEGLPMRAAFTAGAQFPLNSNTIGGSDAFISPNVLLVVQGPFGQVNAGSYIGFGKFFAGAWYRHAFSTPDAVIGSVGMQYQGYKFAYSYDLTLSELATQSGGSHELGVIVNLEELWGEPVNYNDCFELFR